MDRHDLGTIRSFRLVLYNRAWEQRGAFSMPLQIAAPFANRLFAEALSDPEAPVQEPWYILEPHCIHQPPLRRSANPPGPTSLYAQRYVPEREPPPRVRLHPGAHITHFTARLMDLQNELYRGQYTVDDVFLASAEFLARQWIEKGNMRIDEGPFYYAVIHSEEEVRTVSADLFPPGAYDVEGVFQLPARSARADEQPRVRFTRVAPEPPPERAVDTYPGRRTVGRGKPGKGQVLMRSDVYELLRGGLALSKTVEDGGALLGVPYRQPGSVEDEQDPEFRWLVEMTHVVKAEGHWGKPALLLFTGDTWSQILLRRDREFPDRKLVSWFHTHLFKATDDFGLSGLDQDLHRRFMTKPWQVAVLLNIDTDGRREVRCFQRGPSGDLEECTFEVFDPEEGEGPDEH